MARKSRRLKTLPGAGPPQAPIYRNLRLAQNALKGFAHGKTAGHD